VTTRVMLAVLLNCGLCLAVDPPPAYVKNCIACHAVDGSGRVSPALGKIPDLRSNAIVSLSDADLFNVIARADAHKSYPHLFLNRGISESDLRGIVRFIRAVQSRPTYPASGKTHSSR
jgi:mono/diheme cytochrome c family protein